MDSCISSREQENSEDLDCDETWQEAYYGGQNLAVHDLEELRILGLLRIIHQPVRVF